jgi:hypothetical protein
MFRSIFASNPPPVSMSMLTRLRISSNHSFTLMSQVRLCILSEAFFLTLMVAKMSLSRISTCSTSLVKDGTTSSNPVLRRVNCQTSLSQSSREYSLSLNTEQHSANTGTTLFCLEDKFHPIGRSIVICLKLKQIN